MRDMECDNETPTSPGLYVGPVRRPLNSDSEFFDAGNINRALLCKINVFAIITGGGDAMDFEDQQQAYACMFHGCSSTFSSLRRHEAHYETSHRNRCFTCGRSFPTHRLLDLHLSETHDSFFKAMAERRPMYACLVEGCAEVFRTSGKRREHLVDFHRYPGSFDFSRKTGTKGPKVGRGKGENKQMKAAGKRSTAAAGCGGGRKSDLEPSAATADAAAEAAPAPSSGAFQSSIPSPTDRPSRQQQATSAPPPKQPPPSSGAVATRPRDCELWHDKISTDGGTCGGGGGGGGSGGGGGGGGGGVGGALKQRQGEALAAEAWVAASVSTAGVVVRGAGERWRPGSGAKSGADEGLPPGFGVNCGGASAALGEGMEEDGGVDELVGAMSKLMVPRHLRVRSSAQRGDPVG